jgi:hypothetical protein
MPEDFEITGTVDGLEQKRYRDGGGLIPDFWTVKLQTPRANEAVLLTVCDERTRAIPTAPPNRIPISR